MMKNPEMAYFDITGSSAKTMNKQRVNVTEAMRVFAAGRTEVYDRLAYAGNAIQMGRAGIVYALEPEDIEILAEFAEELAHRVKLLRAGLSLTPPRMDDPAGPDGTTYPDQHKR